MYECVKKKKEAAAFRVQGAYKNMKNVFTKPHIFMYILCVLHTFQIGMLFCLIRKICRLINHTNCARAQRRNATHLVLVCAAPPAFLCTRVMKYIIKSHKCDLSCVVEKSTFTSSRRVFAKLIYRV